jgi:hypothetical protein
MKLILITIILLTSQIAHSQTGKLVYFHGELFDEVHGMRAIKRIIKQEYKNNTCIIKVATTNKFGTPNTGSYEIKNDTIFLEYAYIPDTIKTVIYDSINNDTLIVEETSIPYFLCDMYYELDYEIEGIENKNYIIFLNKTQLKLNDKKYLPASYKQIKTKSGKKDSIIEYDDEGYVYEHEYDYNHEVLIKLIKKGDYNKDFFYKKITEYFPTGQVKSEIEHFYSRKTGIPDKKTVKEWDEKGNLITEKTK